ncbi:MAG: hypothetical protein M3539_00555 [Acidobacteriota bacterium]|nr:hypothetical protein [Acidobacteriota bacterium]
MTPTPINRLLDRLDEAKRNFGVGTHHSTEKILSQITLKKIDDAEALIRFHEILLFICAYPQSARLKQMADSILRSFADRVAELREQGADLSALETPEVAGIAGTSVSDTFSYPIVRWLVKQQARRVALDWDYFEDETRLAQTWPRFMPLLAEDASVEANVSYKSWLRAAIPPGMKELPWLVQQFESLPRTEAEKTELFDSQKLYVSWTPPYRATRTGMRLTARKIFYHREPLIRRKDVFLRQELQEPSPVLERLPPKRGQAIIDMSREASTVRYRELYGFTHGDADRVLRTNLGRGVELFVTGIPPDRRLPLRAYHAAMIFKNGVPVGYFEGLSLFERMESGFNLYYTFRDGETAWLYARILNIFRHLLGVTTFAIDPYQIGYENEEGIESGAFWFYRKLGFRPTNPGVLKILLNEEKKLAARSGYRTTAATLRRMAEGPMVFELDESHAGDWDRFELRNAGFRVQRLMGAKFNGDADKFRTESINALARTLGIQPGSLRSVEATAFSDFAVTLSLVKDVTGWSSSEKQLLLRIIRAKASADEGTYLKLMQQHDLLRRAVIELGSGRNQ